jgi:uncharacterized cupredoxin-like copper-binding protein
MKAAWMVALACIAVAPGAARAHDDARAGHASPPASAKAPRQTAFGIAGTPGKATPTIDISMSDEMRFDPSSITVTTGQTVRFRVANKGHAQHEMVIGTMAGLREHGAMMSAMPGMRHDEAYVAHVAPGAIGEIVWTFNRPGDFDFACLINGHYQAGMVGKIKVNP